MNSVDEATLTFTIDMNGLTRCSKRESEWPPPNSQTPL